MDASCSSSLFYWMLTVLSAIGITMIINLSYLFKGVRGFFIFNKHLYKFIHCPMCVGFWSGYLLSDFNIKYAFTSSLCSYTWYLLMKYFIDKYD